MSRSSNLNNDSLGLTNPSLNMINDSFHLDGRSLNMRKDASDVMIRASYLTGRSSDNKSAALDLIWAVVSRPSDASSLPGDAFD